MHTRNVLVASVLLLLLASCSIDITAFFVPATAAPGERFPVHVAFDLGSGSNGGGRAGVVLQLPVGFVVRDVGFTSTSSATNVLFDEPALLGLYQAQPGHYLAGFSASASAPMDYGHALYFVVEAPATTGTYTLKVAGAAQDGASLLWQRQSPNNGNFGSINSPTHAQQIVVAAAPQYPLLTASLEGLPVGGPHAPGFCVADFDHDGRQDVAFAPAASATPTVWLAQAGVGDGTRFVASTPSPALATSANVATGDFDGDGLADILSSDGRVFYGDGTGHFAAVTAFPLASFGHWAIADVNLDGFDDVITADYAGTVRCFLADGLRGWSESSNGLPNNQGEGAVFVGDLTGDGVPDVLFARQPVQPADPGAGIWVGDGAGSFQQNGAQFLGPFGAVGIYDAAMVDVDEDGVTDLLVGCRLQLATEDGVRMFRRVPGTTDSWSMVNTPGLVDDRSVYQLSATDLDGDGHVDVVAKVTAQASVPGLAVFLGDGNGGFTQPGDNAGLPAAGVGHLRLASIDMDGDHAPGLLVEIPFAGVSAYRNTSTGARPFGRACGAPSATLVASGAAVLGSTDFALELAAAPGSLAVLAIGSSAARLGPALLPLHLGLGVDDCPLLVSADLGLVAQLLDGAGYGALAVPLPNAPALRRLVFHAQGFSLTAWPSDVASSGGVSVRIGG